MPELTPPNKKKQSLTNYGKYSALVFQIAAPIVLGVWGGIDLDRLFGLKKFPVFTVTLSLASVFLSVYWVIKDLLKKK